MSWIVRMAVVVERVVAVLTAVTWDRVRYPRQRGVAAIPVVVPHCCTLPRLPVPDPVLVPVLPAARVLVTQAAPLSSRVQQ